MKALKIIIELFLCGVLSLTIACAGAKIRPTGEGVNVITDMVVTEGNTDTTVLIKGSMSSKFNPFKMTDPLRIVIDIANSDVTQLKSSLSVNNGAINDIVTTQMGEETGYIGRVEIGLEKSYKYSTSTEGNNIKVVISKTEAAPELTPSPVEGGSVSVPPPSGAAAVNVPPGEVIGSEVPPVGEEIPPVAEAAPPEGQVAEEPPPVEGEALPPEAAALPPEEAPPPIEGEVPPPEAAPPPVVEAPMTEEVAPPPPTEVPPAEEAAPPVVAAVPPPPPPEEVPRKHVRVEKGKIKLPKAIIFSSSVAQTTPEGEALLKALADFLKENPNLKVRIDGFSDTIGSKEINQALSEYRAIWAKLLLMGMGIPDGRIQVKGFGSSKPIASNKNEGGRAKNRRLEFTVIQ